MKREYENGIKDNVEFFTGVEVEKTPAYDKDTLFVVGVKDPKEVAKQATRNGCDHIYLGANQSFNIDGINEDEHEEWHIMVDELLHSGFWVTLDYDVKFHEYVLENGWNEHDRFISMISVKLPHVHQLNYNACIKIDDKDFKATNPGVWVSYVQEHLDRKKFTDWEKYTKDLPIKVDSEH